MLRLQKLKRRSSTELGYLAYFAWPIITDVHILHLQISEK